MTSTPSSQSERLSAIDAADRSLSAYDYDLPDDYIAQSPVTPRDSSKLLAITSASTHQHCIFRDLPRLLRPGDLLVLNNTRVIPARLFGYKPTGSPAELLLVEELAQNRWLALVKPGRRLKPGAVIEIPLSETPEAGNRHSSNHVIATVVETDTSINGRIVEFQVPNGQNLWDILPQLGQVPLPPYVTNTDVDSDRYQTVYSEKPGAVAAPTAGLHFTPELLAELDDTGISHCFTTLHVGIGTFRPVEAEDITTHDMHHEWIDVPEHTVEQIRQTQAQGGRIIAVGTTVIRALESAAQDGILAPFKGKTNLFIYPGYQWRVVDGLITNFHLPKSSLLMLVSALIGRQRLLALYEEAIAHRYRFYSFGDAMIVLPEAQQFSHHP
jgi:S-adenosylmethionine:tRNA ribosyltransferase-isomerase